jgi:leader peptidase (prepilin peptidase)/N-methyltransferase
MALAIGLCIGSFLNVCIHRLPQGLSIVRPRSRCPHCGASIRAYDNIPVLSYLFLGGRCRSCRGSISARYPLVELLSGAFAAMAAAKFGVGPTGLVMFLFIAALLVITFIDLDHRIIPDVISLPGILVGFGASFGLLAISPLESLIGILSGGGSLFLVAWGYQLIARREGMGGGDIKLLAMIGAFLGWQGVLVTLLLASLVGSIVGTAWMVARGGDRRLAIPFGPFLAVGALIALFWGEKIVAWYISTLV